MGSVLLLCSCGGTTNRIDVPEYDYSTVTHYKNEYSQKRLIKTDVVQYDYDINHKKSSAPTHTSAIDYVYDDGKLITKMEYDTDKGTKRLHYVTNYRGGVEEKIELSGHDTVDYQLIETDSTGKMIRHIQKRNLEVPAFGMVVHDNFDRQTRYDSLGNRVEESITDFTTGRTRMIRYCYDTIPVASQDSLLEIVCYNDEQLGDTLQTKRYVNNVLIDISKEIQQGGTKWELTLNPNRELVESHMTLTKDNERIVVTDDIETQFIDSSFYMKDKEVKLVTVSPDFKTTVFTEYDDYGNMVKESRYTKHNLENR